MTLELQKQTYQPAEQTSSDRGLSTLPNRRTSWEVVVDTIADQALERLQGLTESDAMTALFNRPDETLLSDTESYQPIIPEQLNAFGPVLEIFAHPHSDSADFSLGTRLNMQQYLASQNISTTNMFYELVLTQGEAGWSGHTEQQTISARLEQAQIAAQRTNTNLEVTNLPDGQLLTIDNLQQAKDLIKKKIQKTKPAIIITHSDVLDHQDHVATTIATRIALRELAKEDPNYSPPALYTVTPEFAHRINEKSAEWAIQPVRELQKYLKPKSRRGKLNPFEQAVWNELQPTLQSLEAEINRPIIPQMIIDITRVMKEKTRTLFLDYTQLTQEAYARLIPMLAYFFGIQLQKYDPMYSHEQRAGEPINHIVIDGITNPKNILPSYLLRGTTYALSRA